MLRAVLVGVSAAVALGADPAWYELKKSFSAITVGIAFQDDQIGWTSHTDGSSIPQIVRTHDGGKVWHPVKNNTFKYHALVMGAAAKKFTGGAHAAGADIGTTGLLSSEYSTDGEKFQASVLDNLVSQDISYSAGRLVVTSGKGACVATLSGALYTCHKAPFVSSARYTAAPTKDVIYVAGGQWPSDGVRGADGLVARGDGAKHHALSRNVRVVVDDAVRHVELGAAPLGADPNVTGYVAELFKSGDGGKTWDQLLHDEGNFYFNGIDCIDADNCIAVGEGFGESGGEAGARVYRTTDGKTFKLIHSENTLGTESLMTAKMLSATEYWVGGTTKTGGLLAKMLALHSTDSGATWTNEGAHVTGEAIMSWDWLNATLAYATTVNALQVSSLLKYTTDAPAPAPPSPSAGDFMQTSCTDANCTAGCQSHAFPLGQCLQVTGGGSAEIASCGKTGLVQNTYTSSDCSGAAQQSVGQVGVCLKAKQGGYFENVCDNAASVVGAALIV